MEKCIARAKHMFISFINKAKGFDIVTALSNWWSNESKAAKTAFFSALIVGFISHLFMYTGRYFGNHDFGLATWFGNMPSSGRPFDMMTTLNFGYILPLTSGIMISFFLAVTAFFFCKTFSIDKKISGFLIGSLLSTFPSISVSNLFPISHSYHQAVALAAIAVYLTIRYKFGFILGALLLMFTLGIFQAKFNVAVIICLLFLVIQLVSKEFSYKNFIKSAVRFVFLGGLSAVFYLLLLRFMNITLSGYRGLNDIQDRLFSLSGILRALRNVYADFNNVLLGNVFVNSDTLRYSYMFFGLLLIIFFIAAIIRYKIYLQPIRLIMIPALLLLVPIASLFASFFDTDMTEGHMAYAVVFFIAFVVIMCDKYIGAFTVLKSLTVVCALLISLNYIVINNIFYMRAAFFNQRTNSIAIQLMTGIAPLAPQSDSGFITFFGNLENEFSMSIDTRALFNINAWQEESLSFPLWNRFATDYGTNWARNLFVTNLNNLHGGNFRRLPADNRRDEIRQTVLDTNMPVWPAEGSTRVIDDVIVVNFGITDVVFEEDEYGGFFRARHWISEGHAEHTYVYHWNVFQNEQHISSLSSTSDRIQFIMPSSDNNYRVTVAVENISIGFHYPMAAIELQAGDFVVTQVGIFEKYLADILNDERIVMFSARDDASGSFSEKMQDALHSLGLEESLIGMHRHSYAAIIDGFDVVFESLSDEKITHSQVIDGWQIDLVSAGHDVGNTSIIRINGEDYSLSSRGINIVVLDRTTGEVIDSVAFDTFEPFFTLQR